MLTATTSDGRDRVDASDGRTKVVLLPVNLCEEVGVQAEEPGEWETGTTNQEGWGEGRLPKSNIRGPDQSQGLRRRSGV